MTNLLEEFEKSPYWKFLGLEVKELEQGKVVLVLPYKKDFDNVRDTIHGGVYMSVIDTTMGLLCRSLGCSDVLTIQMNTQFLKPVVGGSIIATAAVISETRSTMLVEGKLFDEYEELIGYSTATFKVIKKVVDAIPVFKD